MDYTSINCDICKRMLSRQRTVKYFKDPERVCILCNKIYCDGHKSKIYQENDICEINHETYYRKHYQKENNIFSSLEHRTRILKKDLDEFSELFMGRDRNDLSIKISTKRS